MMIPKLEDIPENPGVYLMKKKSTIIYVGKAKNLRNRVASYFNREHENIKTRELVKNIEDIEFILCNNEVDAFILENNLIKKYMPKYNILLKDQKTYPYIKITKEKFPAIYSIRTTKELDEKKAFYFGPYPNGVANLKKTLIRIFKLRDCNRVMNKVWAKPCLKYYMHFCTAPCVFKNIEEDYNSMVEGAKKILRGTGDEYISELQKKMIKASEEMKFEEAIILRGQISELKNGIMTQVTEFKRIVDEDYFTFKLIQDRLFITVLNTREGKIVGKDSVNISLEGKIFDNENELIVSTYYSKNPIPKNIIFQENLEQDEKIISEWLNIYSGNKIEISFPKIKSRKKELLEMAELNLDREIETYYKRKSVVESGLMKIYETLHLKNYPRRIECFDISNIQGKDAVASMSVSIEGITKSSEYRKFKITCKDTPDDFEMMREVITRRYTKLTDEQLPDMVLIDGGLGQINAVGKILKSIGCLDKIDLVSLAKREEEVFKYGSSEPYIFSRADEAIKIFQRVRDEAHRFGVTYHRKLRSKRIIKSELDEIKGLGEKRRKILIEKYKSIKNIFEADVEELKKIVPENIAIAIKELSEKNKQEKK
ncbi:MAG: excinuclease ABC subunit UvrC [Fusobacteriaceae bacterium]